MGSNMTVGKSTRPSATYREVARTTNTCNTTDERGRWFKVKPRITALVDGAPSLSSPKPREMEARRGRHSLVGFSFSNLDKLTSNDDHSIPRTSFTRNLLVQHDQPLLSMPAIDVFTLPAVYSTELPACHSSVISQTSLGFLSDSPRSPSRNYASA